jgi:hypothetical protein
MQCLEGGEGTSTQSAKYLVYKLPGESTLVGIECELICAHNPAFGLTAYCRCHLFGRVQRRIDDCTIELFVQLPQ